MESSFDASWISLIGALVASNEETETYRNAGAVPPMARRKGGLLAGDLLTYEMQIRNYLYETALRLPTDWIRRDKTGQINLAIADLAKRATQNWESLASTLIASGSATTYGTALDGKAFFATDHASGASGTQLNYLAAAQVPALNVTTTTAPTPIEAQQAIIGMIGHLLGLKDDQGEPINGEARQFIAMVGTTGLWGGVLPACNAASILGAANTQIANPLVGGDLKVKAVLNPRLVALTTSIFLFRTDGDAPPIVLQQETAPKIEAIAEGSELEITEGVHLYKVASSRNAGYGRWEHGAQGILE
jgi:phage major head subunit gpT-like protein